LLFVFSLGSVIALDLSMSNLKPIKKRHNKVPAFLALDRLAAIPPVERAALRVLDVPAGHGVVTLPLSLAGFDAVGCDLFPETAQQLLDRLTPENLQQTLRDYWSSDHPPRLVEELLARPSPGVIRKPVLAQGDMTKPLPFADGSFDIAICLEGIEHIDTIEGLVAELRRVTRRGGRLLISTPNILCLRARAAYALAGQRTLSTFIDEYTSIQARSGDRIYHGHVFLVDYFELRCLLHNHGYRIREPICTRLSWSSILLAPLMLPWVALATWLAPRRARRRFHAMQKAGEVAASTLEPSREIIRHVLSPALLFGKNLMLDVEAV
jgi:SAM-dependent methyltransferase